MPNVIIREEQEISVLGVRARAFGVVADTTTGRILNQKIKTVARSFKENGRECRISATLEFDDSNNNGHETFSITGTISEQRGGVFLEQASGCIHDEIAEHFPELQHLIKWHLTSTDGPMHYIDNTCYFAGDLDFNGLAKDELVQIRDGKTGEPCWEHVAISPNGEAVALSKIPYIASGEKPASTWRLEWRPLYRVGKGKDREFAAARKAAVWPEATDEELSRPRAELQEALKARLPALLQAFKADMQACGFIWPGAQKQADPVE
jgi:hypothetical protein